jgi:hypothetical protein
MKLDFDVETLSDARLGLLVSVHAVHAFSRRSRPRVPSRLARYAASCSCAECTATAPITETYVGAKVCGLPAADHDFWMVDDLPKIESDRGLIAADAELAGEQRHGDRDGSFQARP